MCNASFTYSYLGGDGAAVRRGGRPVEVVLCQQEWGTGHVQEWVIHQDHLTEVEFVGKALSFSFVQNAFIVVIPAG